MKMKLYLGDDFRATDNWPYAISAGCVVYRQSTNGLQLLLLERQPTHSHNTESQVSYQLPKGHLGFNETLLAAAARETEEEAGCKVEIQTYLGSIQRTFRHPVHKTHNNKTTHYFAALWKEDLSSIDTEHDGRRWFSLTSAIDALNSVKTGVLRNEAEMIKHLEDFLELSSAA